MLIHSPKIITEGLVLYYDMHNTKKSWKGKPTTNLYGGFGTSQSLRSNTRHGWNGTGWTDSPLALSGPDLNVEYVWKFTSGSLNSIWDGNSYGYMYKDMPTANGIHYTGSFYCFVSLDCNIDLLPASSEITSGYNTLNLASSYDMSKKGTWQRIGVSTTGNGSTSRFLAYPQKYGVVDGSFTGHFLIAAPMFEVGLFASEYTPNTRSDTQALIDLTNNFSLNAGLTYSSNNTFSFNGGTNRIITNATINNLGTTWEAWINCFQTSPNFSMFMGSYLPYFSFYNDNSLVFSNIIGDTQQTIKSPATLNINTWYHAAFTTIPSGNNTIATIYVNGELVKSETQVGLQNAPGAVFTIGDGQASQWYPFNGSIPNVKVYNRTLSSTEIKQNFNANRSRYGI